MAISVVEAFGVQEASGDGYEAWLDSDPIIDNAEYARIMRRISIDGDEAVTSVSAFNSSI